MWWEVIVTYPQSIYLDRHSSSMEECIILRSAFCIRYLVSWFKCLNHFIEIQDFQFWPNFWLNIMVRPELMQQEVPGRLVSCVILWHLSRRCVAVVFYLAFAYSTNSKWLTKSKVFSTHWTLKAAWQYLGPLALRFHASGVFLFTSEDGFSNLPLTTDESILLVKPFLAPNSGL